MLESLLIKEIEENGPLTLADYMRQCLYHPQYGYYMKKNPLGRAVDFITTPEISSLFGFVLRTAIESLAGEYNLEDFSIVEFGGGTGFLMEDMLQAPFPIRPAHMVEISPVLQEKQKDRLKIFDIKWHTTVSNLLTSVGNKPIMIVGNEFLDAFPIHQYVLTKEGWKEKAVGLSPKGTFTFQEIPTTFVPDKSYGPARVGNVVEQNPESLMYVDPLFQHIKTYGGGAIFIDYGYTRQSYGDTFQGVGTHQYKQPFQFPGDIDLTAHVNFPSFQNKARDMGLEVLPFLTQREFLEHYGIEFYLEKILPDLEGEDLEDVILSVQRLMNPEGMGSLFKVMIVMKDTKAL